MDLEKENKINLWTTILGDNAVGKSTILRCIAMGLCDETSAGALMKEPKGEFLRSGKLSGHIKIVLKNEALNKTSSITTNITKDDINSPEKLRQELSGSITPWKDIFVCGYGVHIRDGGGDGFEFYKPLEAVYTLFNNNSDLQNPEVILLRQDESFRKVLNRKLLNILMLDDYNIEYTIKGMFINGPFGKQRIDSLSDGYRSTTQWIVDFLGWAIISNRLTVKDNKLSGILLVDELETHLHPRWQRYIIDRLRVQFPKVQFIITTHSPIITLATSDLDDAMMIELNLDKSSNLVKYREVNPLSYKGMRVDQILTSTAFDLPIARSGETGDQMIEFKNLFLNEKKTDIEKSRFKELKKTVMSELPEYGETVVDRKLQLELKEILVELNKKLSKINDKT